MPATTQPMPDHSIPLDDSLKATVCQRLSEFERLACDDNEFNRAAVAFTLLNAEPTDEAAFLLTRRPKHLKRHGGQYALPGGRIDGKESIVEAALRELHEEIGLDLGMDSVLGLLDDYQTRSGFVISPVVVWAGANMTLEPDPGEVAAMFRIPLTDLKSSSIPVLEQSEEKDRMVLSTPLATMGHRVFAPTAAFIYQFREVILFDRPTRVAHFDQPKFAWK